MKTLLKKYFVITVSLFILTQVVPAVMLKAGWKNLFYSSFILTILYYIGRPIANIIMLPINILTLNLASWVINILTFYVWTLLVSELKVEQWKFSGVNWGPISFSSYDFASWQVIILASIFLTVIIQFIDWIVK